MCTTNKEIENVYYKQRNGKCELQIKKWKIIDLKY